ncbi:MAG: hypothetical protein ABJC62_10435 [Frankiaceae bacterium]
MPAGRLVLPPLTDTDVAALRAQLERGRSPRVRLRAGGTGTVVGVGDPAGDGPEYIRVKVTLNGTRDTLPFAAEDLAAAAGGAKASSAGSRTPSPAAPAAAPPAPIPPAGLSAGKAGRRRPQKAPQRVAPNVVITLRTAGQEWLVDAARDGVTITEGVAVSAEVVQAVADGLHDAKLSGAVADVAAVRRAAAAATVERLRAELAAAEGLLTSYTDDAGRRPAR